MAESAAKTTQKRLPTLPGWLKWVGLGCATLIIIVIGLLIGLNLAYANKVLPGVRANGVQVAGLTQAQAQVTIKSGTTTYLTKTLTVNYGSAAKLTATPTQLGVSYNSPAAAQLAINYGRTGNPIVRLYQQLRVLVDRPTLVLSFQYNNTQLSSVVQPIVDAVASPVSNASLAAGSQVTPAQAGNRLNTAMLIWDLDYNIGNLSTTPIIATIGGVTPTISTASLQAVAPQAATYLAAPVTLNLSNGTSQTIPASQIATWLQPNSTAAASTSLQGRLASLSPVIATIQPVTITLSSAAIQNYIATLASQVDVSPVNAQLTVNSSNQVSVFVPSSNGAQLDQTQATAVLTSAIKASGTGRTVAVTVNTLTPTVNEANLNSLGINQLISVGYTTFPEGPADRLQNIAAGASKFNNDLIAPGQTFSFDTTLGPVDDATGFDPALVIENGTVTTADGGGLCQVSTTMYRAALLAGLPITERTNHSFVVSYYTSFSTTNLFGPNAGQSYGADIPGLDATIYLPSPDLQFTNNTGHYILIQTQLGYGYLKFNFYGTAVQYGVIRGPYWTSSSEDTESDATQTTFYRDVYNMSGQLQHTDTVVTNYLPAAEFGE